MKKITGLIFIVILALHAGAAFAQSNLEAELEAKRQAKLQLEEELKQDQAKLDAVSAEKNTLDKAVRELDATGKKLNTEVKLTESKISAAETKIKVLDESISEKERKVRDFRQTIGRGIKTIHEEDSTPFLTRLLVKGSLADAIKETDNQISFNKQMREAIINLGEEKKLLTLDKEERISQKEDLIDYKGEVLDQKKEVDVNKKDKTTLLNQTKQTEAEYQKIIQEKIQKRAQFEDELAAIEAKIKFNLDPGSYPKAKHGILSWPTERVLITQGFGLTESSAKLYGYRTGTWKGKHAGVDFRANNDRVLALADGVVEGTGNTDQVCPRASTGIWVLVKYDNGLANTFFHLSSVVVKKGERVTAGQLVAYSGNTGYSTAPHLHVGVMPASAVSVQTWPSAGCPGKNYTTPVVANSLYLNPLDYFPVAGDELFKETQSGD